MTIIRNTTGKALVNPGGSPLVRTLYEDSGLTDANPRSIQWSNQQAYIAVPSFNTLFGGSPSTGLTISYWVKWTAQATWRGVMNSSTNSSWNDGIGTHWNTYQRAWAGAFSGPYSEALLSSGVWHHVIFRVTVGGTVDQFFDGTKTVGGAFTGPFTGLNNILEIGRMKGSTTWYLVGLLRLFAMYDSPLSDGDCVLLRNGGLAAIPSNIIAGPKVQYVVNTGDDPTGGGTIVNTGTLGATGNGTATKLTATDLTLSTDVPAAA